VVRPCCTERSTRPYRTRVNGAAIDAAAAEDRSTARTRRHGPPRKASELAYRAYRAERLPGGARRQSNFEERGFTGGIGTGTRLPRSGLPESLAAGHGNQAETRVPDVQRQRRMQ
jgi:hypothetical protein